MGFLNDPPLKVA
jgi:hypothetical protein